MLGSPQIGDVLDLVYDQDVGWRPASGAIKPVHVANGLFRAIAGRYYDTTPLVELIAWERHGVPIPERSYEELIKAYPDQYRGFRGRPETFDQVRRYLRGLFAADGAVFPSSDNSSLTLSAAQLISRDHNDRGVGKFAAALLGKPADERSLAAALLRALQLDRPDDPMTTLAWPLLSPASEGKAVADKARVSALAQSHARAIATQLCQAAECLATHERTQGNRLRTLQRAVTFAAVGTQAHAQAISGAGELNRRRPILLAAGASKGSDICDASETSLEGLYDGFETWLAERLAVRIREGSPILADVKPLPKRLDKDRAKDFLLALGMAGKTAAAPTKEVKQSRLTEFGEALRTSDQNVVAALATALVNCYLTEFASGGPREFLQGLCRKVGLLYPHFQGRSREKRISPSVGVLDVLVRSCVPSGDVLPLHEFLDMLWLRFGLVTGGRVTSQPTDLTLLRSAGLELDPGALHRNVEGFVDQLRAMGLARRYADNVTFIGDAYAG